MNNIILSVIGLGKLGVPTSLAFAKAGYRVCVFDVDKNKLSQLRDGVSPIYEPGVQEYLNKYRQNLIICDSINEVVDKASVSFIIVPTPSAIDGTFSLKYVIPVIEGIGYALRQKKDFFVVNVVSTVTPLSMDGQIKPTLEKISGKKCVSDFGLCYNPEFVALGSVISDFESPPFILIGESDKRSGDLLEFIYGKVCKNSPQVARMNFVNAEITKLSLNTYVTTKITYANMLARICEKIDGADVDIVTKALGLDSRIGGKYLKGGLGYGGPCFPRDNRAISSFAKSLGVDTILPETVDAINRNQPMSVVDIIRQYIKSKNDAVGVMGVTYKQDTDVIEESQGLKIAQLLHNAGIDCFVFDRVQQEILPADVKCIQDFKQFIDKVNILVVTVASYEFKELIIKNMDYISKSSRVIIDCWRFLTDIKIPDSVKYIKLGVGKI